MLQSAERSISLVKGGRTEYAAALAWEKKGSFPEHVVFTNWLESTKDNPVVVDFEVRVETAPASPMMPHDLLFCIYTILLDMSLGIYI